jgi:hypothetical protein
MKDHNWVSQKNEVSPSVGGMTPCPCPYRCRKVHSPTLFVRHHPFRSDVEIRQCPNCRRQDFFPTGEQFRANP